MFQTLLFTNKIKYVVSGKFYKKDIRDGLMGNLLYQVSLQY